MTQVIFRQSRGEGNPSSFYRPAQDDEIEITADMASAGARVIYDLFEMGSQTHAERIATEVYRAMDRVRGQAD